MMATAASDVAKVLCLTNDESSALASLLYDIATGFTQIMLASNVREDLMQLYADAYYSGVRIDKPKDQR